MDSDRSSAECLLQDDLEDEKIQSRYELQTKTRFRSSYLVKFLLSVIIILLATNAFFVFQYRSLRMQDHALARSKYAGLVYDTSVVYRGHLDSMSKNWTQRDEFWHSLNTDPIAVAIDNKWAHDHGLPTSNVTFPWDPENKRVYFMKVFHGLHCLKIIRTAMRNHELGNPIKHNPDFHIYHCLDTLRQDLECAADDTPMAMMNIKGNVGEGQVRMCRNFDKLVAWTKERDRNACYHRIAEHPELSERIPEKYAFCEPDNPYYETMQSYFREHEYMPGLDVPEELRKDLVL